MIRLTSALPEIHSLSAEYLRIRCLFDVYKDDPGVLFWEQGEGQAYLSLADGDMTVYNPAGDAEEIRSFLGMLSPETVFSDLKTLEALGLVPLQKSTVLYREADLPPKDESDPLSSRELYDLFLSGGLLLPDYPVFGWTSAAGSITAARLISV